MKKVVAMIVIISASIIFSIPSLAQQFEYPINKEKSFISADDFYQQLKKDQYREFNDASYSVRSKISYRDVPDAVITFEKKTGRYFGQSKQVLSPSIHPDRQVYFFATFTQSKNKEFWKHTIIDAETQRTLEGGNSFHSYDNPYE